MNKEEDKKTKKKKIVRSSNRKTTKGALIKAMSKKLPYDTNLASEFYTLSCLHRLGCDATLTLGNKKAVAIFVSRPIGQVVTIDVKGVAGPYDWPADNIAVSGNRRHFVVLVSYEGRIENPSAQPSVWVVPLKDLQKYIRQYKGRRNVSRADILQSGKRYRDAWYRIVGRRTLLTTA
jgi:hypothetical protein